MSVHVVDGDLFGSVNTAFRNKALYVRAIKIGRHHSTVLASCYAHVGPKDTAGLDADVNSVWIGLAGYDGIDLLAIWSGGQDLAGRHCFLHGVDIFAHAHV